VSFSISPDRRPFCVDFIPVDSSPDYKKAPAGGIARLFGTEA
jgi:hypothetical protein